MGHTEHHFGPHIESNIFMRCYEQDLANDIEASVTLSKSIGTKCTVLEAIMTADVNS